MGRNSNSKWPSANQFGISSMVYQPGRSEVWWEGFRDGFRGYLDGHPPQHNDAYEAGWVLGYYEFTQRRKNDETVPKLGRNEVPSTSRPSSPSDPDRDRGPSRS